MADIGMGQIFGSGLNAAVSLINAQEQRRQEERLRQQKERLVQQGLGTANRTYTEMLSKLDQYNKERPSLADDAMIQQYKDLISNYEPQTYEFEKFGDTYNKSVEDFMNPEAEKIAELAGLKTQAEMAGQGAAKGSGALAGMGYSRWEAARDLYKDAQAQYNADRSQAYQEYGDYIDRMQNKLNTISEGQLAKAQLLGGAVENEQQQRSDYIADLLSVMGDKASTNVNATLGAF